jgi:imidazolonepropionase-like amidohydrolase
MKTLIALALVVAGCKKDAPKGAPPVTKATLVIRNVRVFDGEKVIPRADVAVDGATIVAVGPELVIPMDAPIVDGSGKTLLPGLIDAHVHVFDGGALEQTLAFGVTTVLDMFSVPSDVKRLKDENAPDRADLRSAGTLATAPGGHGTEYGLDIPTLGTPAEAQAFVDARFAEGSDYLKIVYDDGSAYGITIPSVDAPTLEALVDAAHARNKLAVVHIGDYDEARTAIDSGADGIVHSFKDVAPPADFGAAVAKAHAFVTPTLAVLRGLHGGTATIGDDKELGPYLGPAEKKNLVAKFSFTPKSTPGATEALIAQLAAAKVPVLVGTDAPNPGTAHGASVHDELELLVAAGLAPGAALAGATSAPARVFGLTDRGRIAPGLRADLVLVDGDPTTTITDTRRIAGIWRAGTKLDRAAYRARVEQQAAAAAIPIDPGPISTFDDGTLAVRFGMPWAPSTDQMIGGTSTVKVWAEQSAMRMNGAVVASGKPGAWAGAMFMPGPTQLAQVDLSRTEQLAFTVERRAGTGGVTVLVFTTAGGYMPARRTVEVGAKATRAVVTWKELGIDAKDVTGIFIGRDAPGGFELAIDDVALE